MPALACWTVAYAIDKVGRVPVFVEVDEAWAMQEPPARTDAIVVVDPWGSAADWDVAGQVPVRVLDATQSPGARSHGRLAAERFDAAIISFGTAKPICLHGGGVALFRDAQAAREARQLLGFGIERGRWMRSVDRYTFCPWLHAPLADLLERELAALAAHRRQAHELRAELEATSLLRCNPLAPHVTPGIQGSLPVIVDRIGLPAEDVERAAVASGQPLRRHPVAPAYLEPAWTGPRPPVACPRAEHVGSHLLFIDRVAGRIPPLDGVAEFARAIAGRPDDFRLPYRLPAAGARFRAEQLAHWAEHGAVCRAIDGTYWVLDHSTSSMRAVSAAVAAVIQQTTEERHHDRAARTA